MSGIELWWLGQAGFRLRDPAGGPTVFVDPYLVEKENRTWQAPLGPRELADTADVVLSTHGHTDHLDRPTLQATAQSPGARFTLVLPRPLAEDAVELGIPRERVVGAQPDTPVEVAGLRVLPVPARHGVDVADAYTFGTEISGGLVRYLGYVLEIGGVRLYHAGDCIPYEGQAERLRALGVDVALLPINGRDVFRETERNIVGNMDHREAARLASDMGARVLVPMHWEMFAHNRGFPGDLVHYATTFHPELTVLVPGRGAKIVLAPSPSS